VVDVTDLGVELAQRHTQARHNRSLPARLAGFAWHAAIVGVTTTPATTR
jgi:hypothetical protein